MKTPYIDRPQHLSCDRQSPPGSARDSRYAVGERISNRYWIQEVLFGGFAEVYLCLDQQRLFKPVALKTFQRHNILLDLRVYGDLKAEIANWMSLGAHPNIVHCYGMEVADNILFIVLDWIEGEEGCSADLRSRLKQRPLEHRDALQFTIDVCEGLAHAQRILPGILHRDLKPENILVTKDWVAKVTDFGLSRLASEIITESDPRPDVQVWEENRKIVELYAKGVPNVIGDL